jgi:YgiT-type zinc finger domain-containing protein
MTIKDFCKRLQGQTYPGKVTVTLERGDTLVIIKQVPANLCENYGEFYLSEEGTRLVLESAEEAVRKGAEVRILRFAERCIRKSRPEDPYLSSSSKLRGRAKFHRRHTPEHLCPAD